VVIYPDQPVFAIGMVSGMTKSPFPWNKGGKANPLDEGATTEEKDLGKYKPQTAET
jgi:hypothetical protein